MARRTVEFPLRAILRFQELAIQALRHARRYVRLWGFRGVRRLLWTAGERWRVVSLLALRHERRWMRLQLPRRHWEEWDAEADDA